VLGDDDFVLSDEATSSYSRWLHEGFPISSGSMGLVARVAGDEFSGLRGTDGFSWATLSQKLENGGIEGRVFFAGAIAAARVRAEFEDVPVAGVLFCPANGTLAGLAEFFFAWSGTVGFGFAVGHSGYAFA
jgi:hypothetical protein